MRQIFIDTETTGLDFTRGNRIIELGAVEMLDRRLTGNNLHFYFKPDIKVDEGSFRIHGISNEYLADKPLFKDKINVLMNYIKASQVLIHNAPFDLSFLNFELGLAPKNHWIKIEHHCTIIDTLVMARKKHPRHRNSLDALCQRYKVRNSHRQLHGALRDAKILAKVYLMMTGGQLNLFKPPTRKNTTKVLKGLSAEYCQNVKDSLVELDNTPHDDEMHGIYLDKIEKNHNKVSLWRKLSGLNYNK